MSNNKKHLIPLAVLKPLANGPWQYDDYALTRFAAMIEFHRDYDLKSGQTSCYAMHDDCNGDRLTTVEFEAIIKAGAIDPAFYNAGDVNQHWLHSMCQFYAECTKAWVEHQTRTQALLGTPAGRIWRAE